MKQLLKKSFGDGYEKVDGIVTSSQHSRKEGLVEPVIKEYPELLKIFMDYHVFMVDSLITRVYVAKHMERAKNNLKNRLEKK